jgi:hypothetical protein
MDQGSGSNPRRGLRGEDVAAAESSRGRRAASAPRYFGEQSFPVALSTSALGSGVADLLPALGTTVDT